MEYVTVAVVPQPGGGWKATLSVRSTRAVQGHPKTMGSLKPVMVPDLADATLPDVVRWLLSVLSDEEVPTPPPRPS